MKMVQLRFFNTLIKGINMKFLKVYQFGCFFLLSYVSLQAGQSVNSCNSVVIDRFASCCQQNFNFLHQNSHFGSAGFGVTDPSLWYTISTNSYPDAVPLSEQRNKGLSEGGVYLSPTGFTIGEAGNYWVTITVILQNPGSDTILIPVFLAQNEQFDSANPDVGGVVTLEPNLIMTLNGTGIIKDVQPGTRLSLVATNGGAPFPQEVTVAGWSISLFKLP